MRTAFRWSVLLVCLAGVNPLQAAQRPNFLIAVADDWSFGHASVLGCPWVRTPAFDRVAANGIRFDRAYTPNAKCAPSRSILLTGRNSWQLEQACNHMCLFPPRFRTFVEVLSASGYVAGTTGKGWGPGIAKDTQGRRRRMTGVPWNRRKTTPPAKGVSANDYAANFTDFLQAVPTGSAWCFWYGALEPHRGYEFGRGNLDGDSADSSVSVPAYWPDSPTVRQDLLDYACEVNHFDQHLGRMLQAIEAAGQLDNTLVVVTSDHGMPFPRCKGQAYEHSNHVPLAMMWPAGISGQGHVVQDYVSFADVAPTVIEAAGLRWDDTGLAPASGTALSDIFMSGRSGQVNSNRDHVLVGKERHDVGRPQNQGYPIRGIVRDNWLYLCNYEPDRWPAGNPSTGYLNCDGSPTKTEILQQRRQSPDDAVHWDLCFGKRPPEELYDLTADPDCVVNLAYRESEQGRLDRYRSQMEAELRAQGDPRMEGNGHVFEQYPYSSPATDHFYERYLSGESVRAGWVNADDFETQAFD